MHVWFSRRPLATLVSPMTAPRTSRRVDTSSRDRSAADSTDGETRDVVRAVLAAAGAKVATACSALEALTELSDHVPDVLMSDIAMPQCDGYELMRRVREQHHYLPSIALTAYGSAEDRDRATAA